MRRRKCVARHLSAPWADERSSAFFLLKERLWRYCTPSTWVMIGAEEVIFQGFGLDLFYQPATSGEDFLKLPTLTSKNSASNKHFDQ
jgi:hypothetical protein